MPVYGPKVRVPVHIQIVVNGHVQCLRPLDSRSDLPPTVLIRSARNRYGHISPYYSDGPFGYCNYFLSPSSTVIYAIMPIVGDIAAGVASEKRDRRTPPPA